MADAIFADEPRRVTGGVDTHKHTHVAAVVDHLGGNAETREFANTAAGHRELVGWLRCFGEVALIGVEGTGSYGAGLARHLRAEGLSVVEVNRTNRQDRRRVGKSDPLDAIAAARAALGGTHAGAAKSADGIVEAIRHLRVVRRSAVRARTATMNQLRAVIDTAPEAVRGPLMALNSAQLVTAVTRLRPGTDLSDPAAAARWALRALAQRHRHLSDQIGAAHTHLEALVAIAAPNLLALNGVGADVAAALLVAAGDNPARLGSEAAFAALCGVNPLPASSGITSRRHRLNRAGNRDANNALWRIVMVRLTNDAATRAYLQRRSAQGLSKREIIRCLKRYVARQIYPILLADLTATP